MPTVQRGQAALKYRVGGGMNKLFDLIQNCKVIARKSDEHILQEEYMCTMRDGTTRVGNSIGSATGTTNQIFFTGQNGTRSHYIAYNSKVYKNVSGTWTDIGATLTNNSVFLNVVKLPAGNPSSTYTASATATGIEKVKVSGSDSTPVNNVGKYIMIVGEDNPTATQYNTTDTYRNKYAYIESYDTTNNEYLLVGLGNAKAIESGAKYKIFNKLDNYLQITNGVDNDQYYDGSAIQTIFTGRMKQHIGRLTTSTAIGKTFMHDNLLWTWINDTFFRSEPLNLLWFDITDTIKHDYFDVITEVFTWKDKLIVGGKRSTVIYKYDTTLKAYTSDIISNNYGIKQGGVNNFEKDVYIFTSNRELISLSQNIYGVILPNNVGKPVNNYLQTFNYSIVSGFDGRKFYLYGESSPGTIGTTIVYDTHLNFWSIYTGIRPSNFLLESETFYITSNNKGEVYYFNQNTNTDNGIDIEQKISTINIQLDDVFSTKEIVDCHYWFENYTQDVTVSLAFALTETSAKLDKTFNIEGIDTSNSPIGEEIIGDEMFGGTSLVSDITLPRLFRVQFPRDGANIYKVIITGKDGSPFYFNEVDVTVQGKNTDYFNPELSI